MFACVTDTKQQRRQKFMMTSKLGIMTSYVLLINDYDEVLPIQVTIIIAFIVNSGQVTLTVLLFKLQ